MRQMYGVRLPDSTHRMAKLASVMLNVPLENIADVAVYEWLERNGHVRVELADPNGPPSLQTETRIRKPRGRKAVESAN